MNGTSSVDDHDVKVTATTTGVGEVNGEAASRRGADDSSSSSSPSPRKLSPQELALKEADEVLAACDSFHLQEFNLLGVVANPRDSSHGGSSYASRTSTAPAPAPMVGIGSSTQQQQNQQTTATDSMTETIQSLELTVAQVKEQIDNLNEVFDAWSRQYLGTYYEDVTADTSGGLMAYVPSEESPTTQLTSLPPELEQLSLASVQAYMDKAGLLAGQFRARQTMAEQDHLWHENISAEADLGDFDIGPLLTTQQDVEAMEKLSREIPDVFFQTYFDLTNETTFRELLVEDPTAADDGNPTDDGKVAAVAASPTPIQEELPAELPACLREPTSSILPLPSPDAFTSHLDAVEIALLQQVRSKSIAFFHETNRFGQLKDWIAGLVEEVQRVRALLENVRDKSVVAWELIPLLDQQRCNYDRIGHVLEAASEVLHAKQSIGGFLSANDDLGAARHIQFGRKLLLRQQHDDGHDHGDEFDLSHLQALSTVGAQLEQYENLVVANLGEELVELFLGWSPRNTDPDRARELMYDGLGVCGRGALERVYRLYVNRLLDVMRMTTRTTVGEFAEEADSSVKACVTSMTLERFLDCLKLLLEQLLDSIKNAVAVQDFCTTLQQQQSDNEDSNTDTTLPFAKSNPDEDTPSEAVSSAAELSAKSIAELLRLRKEAHSLVSLEEMKMLWNVCLGFLSQVESLSAGFKATGLRATLLSQAKAFVERKHESNMSALAAALDSERWTQCDVSADRQAQLTRLCSGRAVTSSRSSMTRPGTSSTEKSPEADVEGVRYKVVWSSLFLVEMVMMNIDCAAHFQSLATNVVSKVSDLLRLFNSRSTQLVLGAGAIHSAARLKSINAKHLSLVTQCLGMTIAILPHVRAALMAQLPQKQHKLLTDLDSIKKEYAEHNEKVLNKFVTIVGGIVEHGLAPRIGGVSFDNRARQLPEDANPIACCTFLDGVSTNTRKMHHVLNSLLPQDHLQDVFSRILAFLDHKVPALFDAADATPKFSYPTTDPGKRRMLLELETMTNSLNALDRVLPWEFTVVAVLERRLDYVFRPSPISDDEDTSSEQTANVLPEKEPESPSDGEELENGTTAAKQAEANDETTSSPGSRGVEGNRE